MLKRIICLLLAFIMLLGLLVGCKKDEESSSENDETSVSTVSDDSEENKDDIQRLDGVNYGGKDIIVSVRGDDSSITELGTESKGDLLSEVLYERTVTTQERIGVKVKLNIGNVWSSYNKTVAEIRNSVGSQMQAYDIVAGWSYRILPLTLEGLFQDLNTTKYYDSDDDWWSKTVSDALTVNGKIYMNTGDIAASYMDACCAIAINDTVAKEFKYEYDNFYDIVYSGEWTIEYLDQIVKNVYKDENGNQIRDDQDTFGYVGWYSDADAFWAACNINIIDNNGEDRPTLSFNVDKIQGAVDKIYKLFYENTGVEVLREGVTEGQTYEDPLDHFQKDRSMFTFVALGNLSILASMKSTYGVLPMPKYDKAQENYGTYLFNSMSLWGIPVDSKDMDMSSAVLTSMGYDSRELVIETHYETLLKTRYVKDSTSGFMIDIIYNNVYMNFDSMFNEALAASTSGADRLNTPVMILRRSNTTTNTGKFNAQAWWASNEIGYTERFNNLVDGYFNLSN